MTGKRGFALALCLMACLIAATAAGAQEFFTANDLAAVQITATTKFGAFAIYARSDKGVTVEAMSAPRVAADGEVFNNRIKLNGGGAMDYRSIHFTTGGNAEVAFYANSSSKTDARTLVLVNVADGAVIAELVAPADDEKNAGIATAAVPRAGEYALYSKSSGINIYQIVIK
ncbi:MAG TPA: hypothetical protein VN445_06980 [Rectinemataceae bacterium]|nr:hypothetical protein [Rectinemataceae bacterium]